MFSNIRYSFARAALHGLAILGLVLTAGVSASPAYAAVPSNDNIANSINITTAAYAGTLLDITGATTEVADPVISCGGAQGYNSVWYTFAPLNSGEVSLNTTNSQYDTILAVFKNDPLVPGGLIELGCNDDSGGTISALTMPLRGGIRYYIEVISKAVLPATPAKRMRINYSFSQKVVAWSDPLGKKWDSTDGGVFTFSSGWQLVYALDAYKGAIHVSNKVNNTAVVYFDGNRFDLYYTLGPEMGYLDVYVDNVLQVTLGQGNSTYVANRVWSSSTYSDGVHKLLLRHGVFGTKANFDYITVYSFPDVIPPAQISDLTATTDVTGKVTLKWTSVGDDGLVGTAASYEVRYFLSPIPSNCQVNWSSGGSITYGLPAPAIAGTVQQATLNGLAPGVAYDFCIAAVDDAGNMGVGSNMATATASAGVPYGTGAYDDNNAGWSYTGKWTLVSDDPDARYGTLHVSNKVGNYTFFFFTGTQFVFTYASGPFGDLLDVYIDGMYETTLDQYAPSDISNRIYTSRMIPPLGPHSVRFVHNHLLGSPSSRSQVKIDQIYINSPDDGGPPNPINLSATAGASSDKVDLAWTATGDDPGGVGTASHYAIRYSTAPILTELDWIYASPAAGVIPAPHPAGTYETMAVEGLTPGVNYWFAVCVSDDAFYHVLSNSVQVDAVPPVFPFRIYLPLVFGGQAGGTFYGVRCSP